MNIKIFSIAILASLLCLSCTDTNLETTAQSDKTQTNGTLHTYDVEIEAGTFNPSSRAALTRMADMPYKITEENLQGETVLYPKLDIPDKTTMPSLLVLCKKIENAKTHQFEVTKRITVQANWKVSKKGTETDLLLDKLSIYEDLKQGEWYLMAFMGGGEVSGEQLKVKLNTTANLIKKDQAYTAQCPYATTWRRVVVNGGKLKLQNEKNRMMFKPQGVFLMIDAESRMSLDTKLAREVQLESNAFCSQGVYKFETESLKKQNITDDADLLSEYWKPSDVDRIKDSYPVYTQNNGEQYVTRIYLNSQSGFPDGTVTSGKSDLNNFMYFNKKGTGAPQKSKQFLLCLMPVDYKKTAAEHNPGVTTEALFYGKVFIEDSGRKYYTYDKDTYKEDPSTWKPYMESKYLLGSFSNNLTKGSCYSMRLRIVRPMLPIERLWAFRQGTNGGTPMKNTNRGSAERIAEGDTHEDRSSYPGLPNGKYRFPKYSELMPILHNCELSLENQQAIGTVPGYNINNEYGFANAISAPKNQVNINGTLMKFDNWFCHQHNSNDMYGIMYIKPFGGGGPTSGNYKVAYRLTFNNPAKPEGDATISVYYLGPNYNLSNAVAGFYCCHADFWKRIERDELGKATKKNTIERTFPLGGDYWLNDKVALHKTDEGETRSQYNKFNFDAEAQPAHNDANWRKWSFFLPWLKEPAW